MTDDKGGIRRIEVASYNIHRCIGLDRRHDRARIAEVIRELAVDVVALQEVESESAAQQPEYLSWVTGFRAVLGPTLQRRDGHYGNALLLRPPVLEVRHIDLSVQGKEPRGALDVDVAFQGAPIRLITTHFGLTFTERYLQVMRLLKALRNGPDHPTILLGDFNEWRPAAPVLRRLEEFFGRPWSVRTYPARYPLLALDRVWVRPMTALRGLRVHVSPLARVASDHLPVRATIDLRPVNVRP